MRQGFKQLIIGFLFILLEVHVIVDILPDFIGYIFIYNGIKLIATQTNQPYEKLKNLCILLAVLSVPSFFLNDQTIPQIKWLEYYPILLSLIKILLMYYLFNFLGLVVKFLPAEEAIERTNRMYYWYMVVTLGALLVQSFLMNMPMNANALLLFIVMLASFIIEISFLVYLRNIQKQFPKDGVVEKFV